MFIAQLVNEHSSARIMSSKSPSPSGSKSGTSYGKTAKSNIDRLERQLEDANREIKRLTAKNEELAEENSKKDREIRSLEQETCDYDISTGDLNSEIQRLEDENNGLEAKVASLRTKAGRCSKVEKTLKDQKRRNEAQAKALEIAKRTQDFSDSTMFKTWVELQAQFKDAVAKSDNICGERCDGDGASK